MNVRVLWVRATYQGERNCCWDFATLCPFLGVLLPVIPQFLDGKNLLMYALVMINLNIFSFRRFLIILVQVLCK